MRKDRLKLFLIVSLLVAVRFLWLTNFPPGFNHDEADVVLSAKSYFVNGADISGVRFPVSLFATKTQAGLAGLPSLALSPFLGIMNLNLMNTRFVFVLVNLITGVFLSLLVWRLSKNGNLSIISFLVFLVNPWSVIYSRSLTEAPFALLFILIGSYSLFSTKSKNIFYSLIFFVFAFFSYFGAKPLIPFLLIFLLGIHKKFIGRTNFKQYFIYFGIFILFFASYFVLGHSARSSELIFSNLNKYSSEVNDARRISIDFLGNSLFNNKIVSLFWDITHKYFSVYSPDYLLFGGDPRATYRLGGHGMFYVLDIVFIVLGIYGLSKQKDKRLTCFTAIVFLIGPIGSAISSIENSYVFRSFLLLPGFVILISVGINSTIECFNKTLKPIVIFAIFSAYFFLSFNFFNFYFFRFPVVQQENNFFSERILSNYLYRSKSPKVVVVGSPIQIFQQYLFFSGYLNSHSEIPQPENGMYLIDNILISNDCNDIKNSETFVLDPKMNCKNVSSTKFLQIQNEKDAGVIFKIYNDKMCSSLKLDPWKRFNFISDYSVEKLRNSNFCERWINE